MIIILALYMHVRNELLTGKESIEKCFGEQENERNRNRKRAASERRRESH